MKKDSLVNPVKKGLMNYASVESFLRELGAYQLEGFRKLQRGDIQVKEGTSHGLSVVTEYDLESERRTHDFVARHFPGDSFLGEEHGNVRRDPERYWVLDPIDGTSNYTQGVVYWGPTLAFFDREGPAAGWIYLPAIEQMFFARRGEGAFLNGSRIQSSGAHEYNDLSTVGTTSRLHRRFRLTVPAKHRILGSLVANLAYLATGTFAAVYCRGNIWDLAAGVLIASEAGAVVECRPELRTLDLPTIDVKSQSITMFGRGNASLPSLESYLVPV
jgi:myo-inositol-1(or 4)-monophosphatase